MKYFKKELWSQKLYCKATGAPFPFELVGGDNGVLATDNPVYVDELDIAISKGIGGVVLIDEPTFTELKKKASGKPSLKSLVRDRSSLSFLSLPQAVASHVNPAADAKLHGQLPDTPKPEPIEIPTTFVRPKTGKFLKKADE